MFIEYLVQWGWYTEVKKMQSLLLKYLKSLKGTSVDNFEAMWCILRYRSLTSTAGVQQRGPNLAFARR